MGAAWQAACHTNMTMLLHATGTVKDACFTAKLMTNTLPCTCNMKKVKQFQHLSQTWSWSQAAEALLSQDGTHK
jgi:hypothetical protein